MKYGVMYDKGDSSIFKFFSTWEEAIEEAYTLGYGAHHATVALYALDSIGGDFVRILTI